MSPDEWEEFIEEWMTFKSTEYYDFERLGGAGDQGRDVVGYVDNPKSNNNYLWDNFQCKHYSAPLAPSNIWVEIAKICYYAFINEYPFPRKYYFIAPHGVGTKLSNYLKKPDILKEELYNNWENYCRSQITETKKVELVEPLRQYIDGLDFSIFDKISTIKIIMGHSKTQFHVVRFGTPLPKRPKTPQVPENIKANEINYVGKLINAYDSHCKEVVKSVEDAKSNPIYQKHLKRSREDFLHAETLRNFSRDTLPSGEFEGVQDQLLNGVADIVDTEYPNGFDKVKDTISEAKKLQLPTTPLTSCLTVNDRGGICHQLANDDKIFWCDDND